MVAANERTRRPSQGSSRELRSSVSKLLLDVSGKGWKQEVNNERRNSLQKMDVPDSTVPNRPGSNRSLLSRSGSVVFNQQGKGEVEKYFNVVMTRDTTAEPWGLSFNQLQGHLVITKIVPGGLTDRQTELEVGDLIWCIADGDCTVKDGMSDSVIAFETWKVLKNGFTVSIRAKKPTLAERTLVEAKIVKQAKGDSLGFSFGRKTLTDGKLFITKTTQGGLAVNQTDLRPGYEIVAIDGVNCTGMSVEEAGKLLQQDEVQIRARKLTLTSGTSVLVTLNGGTDSKVGMVLGPGESNDTPRITNIRHDSRAYHSMLEPGMIIESINDEVVKGRHPADVGNVFANVPDGPVKIQARVP